MTTSLQRTSLGELGGRTTLLTTSLGELGGALATGFTYRDLILEAREMLGDDNDLCYRYTDEDMVDVLNRGIAELYRIRPDAFYQLYGVYADAVPEIVIGIGGLGQYNWENPFQPEPQFYNAVLQYVVSMIELSEDPYTESGSAVRHLELFRTLVLNT